MNSLMKMFFRTLLLCIPISSFAGGWTSGGGELLGNSQNPWWLKNTPEVKYCILVDEQNFGSTLPILKGKISEALSYWKKQLAKGYYGRDIKFGDIILGQQNFIEMKNCDEADLRFQFGLLDDEQLNFIQNPKKYVGLTIRTEYDQKTLKGKGFIYISPQGGPLKPEKLPKDVWSINEGSLLLPTLIHELGHVFGLQHSDLIYFMRDDFLELILSEKWYKDLSLTWTQIDSLNYLYLFRLEDKFSAQTVCTYKNQNQTNLVNRFWGLKKEDICTSMLFSKLEKKLYFYAGKEISKLRLIGTADLEFRDDLASLVVFSKIHLEEVNKDQFENIYKQGVLFGTGFLAKGKYTNLESNFTRDVSFHYTNGRTVKTSAFFEGVLYNDINLGF